MTRIIVLSVWGETHNHVSLLLESKDGGLAHGQCFPIHSSAVQLGSGLGFVQASQVVPDSVKRFFMDFALFTGACWNRNGPPQTDPTKF